MKRIAISLLVLGLVLLVGMWMVTSVPSSPTPTPEAATQSSGSATPVQPNAEWVSVFDSLDKQWSNDDKTPVVSTAADSPKASKRDGGKR